MLASMTKRPADMDEEEFERWCEEQREIEQDHRDWELRDAGIDPDDPEADLGFRPIGDPTEVDEDGLYPDGSREDEPGPGMG